MGVCSARGDREHGALGVGDPPSLPFLRFPQRTRGSEREELGVIVEGGKPFPEGRSPNRRWRQCREGGRKPGLVWVPDGEKRAALPGPQAALLPG